MNRAQAVIKITRFGYKSGASFRQDVFGNLYSLQNGYVALAYMANGPDYVEDASKRGMAMASLQLKALPEMEPETDEDE